MELIGYFEMLIGNLESVVQTGFFELMEQTHNFEPGELRWG